MKTIQYGIGKEYLKDWSIQDALREIYQNFLDFGEYTEVISPFESDKVRVIIFNKYLPEGLEFLRIGNSVKHNNNAIGKHGEGLKMAYLIMLREKLQMTITTGNQLIYSHWHKQPEIGETLSLGIKTINKEVDGFEVMFTCPKELFTEFHDNIITDNDIIFSDSYHGDIVNKPKGNLYSGKLFVCNVKNLSKAYNLRPEHLHLDRDRKVPGSFETSYHTSKINEAEGKLNFVDTNYSDTQYIERIPEPLLKTVKAREIAGKVEFIAKVINPETNQEEEMMITNHSIKETLKKHSMFDKAIKGIKNFIASKLGIKDLLLAFRVKHCNNTESRADFDLLLERLGIDLS